MNIGHESHVNVVCPLQENVQSLQTAVGSLQKEKEELIHALQSAKKDNNQAK